MKKLKHYQTMVYGTINTLLCSAFIGHLSMTWLAAQPTPLKKNLQGSLNAAAAIGENTATPVDRIKAPEGFNVELLYSVPSKKHGSWVALCANQQGTIYASDQYGGLYRFNPPAPGQSLSDADIHKVPVDIRAINGMVFVDGDLYAGVNDYERKIQSGFYRITDTDADGELDQVELLKKFQSRGDHGVHAVVPSPDGKYFYLITGNNAIISPDYKEGTSETSPVRKVWGDDHLLSRMPDGRGHNRHVLAPGGIVYRVSRKDWTFEIFASGFRNIYGAGINEDGELFTYDADMEYDFNTPWYRPTRINHVVSGAEFGWRNGAGKYPDFYAETLPASLDIGPGSPTGARFGYGARFPDRYQRAFYALDWSWGKIYAVHLEADGASYSGTKEEFITGAPLPVTDVIIHPQDGHMYFTIGGRRVQSGLYRVTYQGKADTAPVSLQASDHPLRSLRRSLELFHGKQDTRAVETAWPHLNHEDRFIRAAARVVLEHQPLTAWASRATKEPVSGRRITALLALARVSGVSPSHRSEERSADNNQGPRIIESLLELDFQNLTEREKLAYVRLLQITLIRFDASAEDYHGSIIDKLDPAFPAETFELNWLLCETLAYLQAPSTARKGMDLIASAESQEPQMQYARSLRFLKKGWTPDLRRQQLEWFLKAANYRGGASFDRFIEFIRQDSLASFSENEKSIHAALIAREPTRKSVFENVGGMFANRVPTEWSLEELGDITERSLKGRHYENGRKLFSAAACFACHRFGNAGGMNGPDLTGAGGRFSPRDLLDHILHPSKVISDQFAPILVTMEDDEVITGIVVNLNRDTVTLNTDLTNPNQRTNVDRKNVKNIELSKVSPMPSGLLDPMTKVEIMDLMAYILSGGDRSSSMFAP
jgi:putative heme-binding domain-containing protein